MKKSTWANVFLILIWITFVATFHLERLIWGVLIIAAFQWIYAKKLHSEYFSFYFSFPMLTCWVRYAWLLIKEIWKANIQVAILVLQPKIQLSSGYFIYTPKLKKDFTRMVFANSITLTPGTITVDYVGDQMIVHYLTEINVDGFENSDMERILLEMEAFECLS